MLQLSLLQVPQPGKKKAVVLTHENLIDRVFSSIVNKNEVYLQILPYHHIFSTCDFFGGLKMEKIQSNNLQLYQPTCRNVVPLIAKNLLNRVKFIREENPNIMNSFIIQYQRNLRQFDTIWWTAYPNGTSSFRILFSSYLCIFDTGKQFTLMLDAVGKIFSIQNASKCLSKSQRRFIVASPSFTEL